MTKIFLKKYQQDTPINTNTYLNIITCTYPRLGRINYLKHLKSLLDNQNKIRWIVVDDNDIIDQELIDFLPNYAIHLYCGPTRDKGHAQRNMALEYIHDNNLDGIIYNADDDNKFDNKIFDELRKTNHIGILPVGNFPTPKGGSERPIIINGKFKSWNSFWHRKFPVDMAGFAFNATLLRNLKKPYWKHKGVGGESEFLSKIASSEKDLQFLCNNCNDTYVWHNELLSQPFIHAKEHIDLNTKENGPIFGKTSGSKEQYNEIKYKIFNNNITDDKIKLIEKIFIDTEGVYNSPDRAELCAIANEIMQLPHGSDIVEIGCWRGRTTTLISNFKQDSNRLLVVDNFESNNGLTHEPHTKKNNIELFNKTIEKFNLKDKIHIIDTDSTKIKWSKYVQKNNISCIFYDGDPSLLSIKKTILNIMPYINEKKCTIIFHDAAWADHRSFINTLCIKYKFFIDKYINIWEGLVILHRNNIK